MKKFWMGIVFLVLCTSMAQAATDGRAGIAAIVNTDVITLSDVTSRVQLYLSGAQGAPPPEARAQMQAQILDRLIDESIQMQEAKALGIAIPPEHVQEAFAQIARQNGLAAEDFRKKLDGAGVRVDTLYDQIRTELAWAQVVRRKLRPQINVSESEIDNVIGQITRSKQTTQYHVAEIFLATPDPAQEADVRREADKLVQQLTRGASFSQVARQFSQAPGASAGGDMGWIQEGQLDPALDAALKQMKPGQVSPPLQTGKGYHIIFLRDLRQPESGETAQMEAPAPETGDATADIGPVVHLKQILIPVSPQDPQPVVNAKIARAQSLQAEITSCDLMDAKAKDFLSPGTGDLGRGPLAALPEPLRGVVANLEIGVLSPPVRNEAGVAVVMVCGREGSAAPVAAAPPPRPAPRSDDASREEVANRLGMQRLDLMQERYLRDLRATAFIDKRI